ncbi:hypothetical protein CRE_23437 [Caenorhabditis remanei]|uniref:F-box domain-containing protein n=1 Tax=Caenorhabditis remanei TaxID=31234 RepID=E3MGR9_CAERE|nr:hypothetical protein CRE_23437 [Caenorhabditis remanei]
MASGSPLLKLPEIVMDNVLHYSDYLEIASLRKTCRSLRKFVDAAKPDARMDKVEIECEANKVIFRLQSGGKIIDIVYRNGTGGCYVFNNTNWKKLIFEGMDHIEIFKNDLAVFLKHQKSLLKEMEIKRNTADIDQVFIALKAHATNSKTRNLQLKTTKLSLNGLSAPQSLLAVSSVDAQSLRSLSIKSKERVVLIDEITETEQWRHLDTCSFSGFRISDVRRISHLNEFLGLVTSVTAADLAFLKTAFLNSSNFCSCKINCNSIADLSQIAGVQPFPSRTDYGGVSLLWFFRMPNDTSRVLSLDVNNIGIIDFGPTVTARVPTGAVIID